MADQNNEKERAEKSDSTQWVLSLRQDNMGISLYRVKLRFDRCSKLNSQVDCPVEEVILH